MRIDKLKDLAREKERQTLIRKVDMLLLQNQMLRDTTDEYAIHAPINAGELGLHSTFYDPQSSTIITEELTEDKVAWFDVRSCRPCPDMLIDILI